MNEDDKIFPLIEKSRWININTGKKAFIIEKFHCFNGIVIRFKKDNGSMTMVAEEQFISMYKPDFKNLDLIFSK